MAAAPQANPAHGTSAGYNAVHQDDDDREERGEADADADADADEGVGVGVAMHRPSKSEARFRIATFVLATLLIIMVGVNAFMALPFAFTKDSCLPEDVPQYFRTSPELWAGPTATGKPAFMAQTRVLDPTATYVPNEPLQTAMPIQGMSPGNKSIFHMMGYLSPYAPSPGFGVDEYPIPDGAEIVQVQMLSRHGSRYPTMGAEVIAFGQRIADASSTFKPKGALGFMKDWRYQLGHEILVPKGREELFQSGVLHSYMYGSLYNPNSKLIVRTTTQDRMLKSAENWMAGFFGLEWAQNATIEVIIEESGFNNSLAGSLNCPNSHTKTPGIQALSTWAHEYLKGAQSRLQSMTEGFDWTIEDVYAAQTMCPYETVAYGYSRFCDLFTYEEWQDFGYSVDLLFSSISGFHSPTGVRILCYI